LAGDLHNNSIRSIEDTCNVTAKDSKLAEDLHVDSIGSIEVMRNVTAED